MISSIIRAGRLRHRRASARVLPSLLVFAFTVVLLDVAGIPELRAATADPVVYTPTLYVYQNDELIDVKTFKVADLEGCQHRASALLQLYLNHSDIEDDMRLVVRCVRVPPASAGHRKGEQSPDGEHHQRMAESEVTL
jgi:hypothetical protein